MMEKQLLQDRPLTSTEENVYADVYKVLLGGMFVSTGLFVIGIVTALLRPHFVPLTPQWIKLHYHLGVLFHGVRTGDPTSIMLIATAILILTPVARVIVSIYAFAVDGDRKYVAITSAVLVVMAVTVVLGLLGLK